MRQFACVLAIVAIIALSAGTAAAGVISGSHSQTVIDASSLATILDNTGTYVSGVNLGAAGTAVTINGVLFKNTASGTNFEGGTNTPGTFLFVDGFGASGWYLEGGTSYNATFAPLLNSGAYENASYAVVGLDPAKTYRLDFLSGNNVSGEDRTYTHQIYSGTFTSGEPGTYVEGDEIGSFTISNLGTTGKTGVIESFQVTGETAFNIRQGSGANVPMSGMALHIVPEPSAIVLLLCMGAIGLLAYAWRKRKN